MLSIIEADKALLAGCLSMEPSDWSNEQFHGLSLASESQGNREYQCLWLRRLGKAGELYTLQINIIQWLGAIRVREGQGVIPAPHSYEGRN